MIATPYSEEQYYPMILSNGNDCVLVDYTGSNYVSRNGHTHFEQHQGVSCGWYKASHASVFDNGFTQPIIMAGVQVILQGVPCELSFYEQAFEPRTATLTTNLTFAKVIKIQIESFVDDEGIWNETVRLIECPKHLKIDLGFDLLEPTACIKHLKFQKAFSVNIYGKKDILRFDYTIEEINGKGFLKAERAFDEIRYSNKKDGSTMSATGFYHDVREGASFSRCMVCADDSEKENVDTVIEKKERIIKKGQEVLRGKHHENWAKYFSTCSIEIPDKKLQYVYDLSRYVIKANCNLTSGVILLGILPNLWRGGICCSYDAQFALRALITAGNKKEYERFLNSILVGANGTQAELKKYNMQGKSFSGWTDCYGGFPLGCDYIDWLTKIKPMFGAYIVIAAYYIWLHSPEMITEEYKRLIRDYLLFLETEMVVCDKGTLGIKNVQATTESGLVVEGDSFTVALFAKAFTFAGIMMEDERCKDIGQRIMKALDANYREDGVLLSHKNAETIAGATDVYMLTLPDPIDIITIDKFKEAGKSFWGYSGDANTEVYRNWSWYDTEFALCYIHEGEHEKAMEHINHITYGCSALGALPEKIRMDGAAINYWYISPHALVVWALNDAFAFTKEDDDIRLAYGFTAQYQNFACRDVSLHDNIKVSYRIEKGRMTMLRIQNLSRRKRNLNLCLNDAFSMPEMLTDISVQSGDTFNWQEKA